MTGHEFTREEDEWILDNMANRPNRQWVHDEFLRKFDIGLTYQSICRRYRTLRDNPWMFPDVYAKPIPTEIQVMAASQWLKRNCPSCITLATDRCRAVSGYDWDFDQVRNLAVEIGAKIVPLELWTAFPLHDADADTNVCSICGTKYKGERCPDCGKDRD